MIFNSTSMFAQQFIELKVESKYIHLPVTHDNKDETRLELVLNNNTEQVFDIWLVCWINFSWLNSLIELEP